MNAMNGLMLAFLISCNRCGVGDALDCSAERVSSRGCTEAASQPHPAARSAVQYPDTRLPPSPVSGAQFAENLASRSDLVTMSGWFHIIWNGAPRYRLVDNEGEWTDLLIEEGVLRDMGGPLALNRQRVRVTGYRQEGRPRTIQVITIKPDERSVR